MLVFRALDVWWLKKKSILNHSPTVTVLSNIPIHTGTCPQSVMPVQLLKVERGEKVQNSCPKPSSCQEVHRMRKAKNPKGILQVWNVSVCALRISDKMGGVAKEQGCSHVGRSK